MDAGYAFSMGFCGVCLTGQRQVQLVPKQELGNELNISSRLNINVFRRDEKRFVLLTVKVCERLANFSKKYQFGYGYQNEPAVLGTFFLRVLYHPFIFLFGSGLSG